MHRGWPEFWSGRKDLEVNLVARGQRCWHGDLHQRHVGELASKHFNPSCGDFLIAVLLCLHLRDLAHQVSLYRDARPSRLDLFGRAHAKTGMNLTTDQAPRRHLYRARERVGARRQELSPGQECEWVCAVACRQRLAVQSVEWGGERTRLPCVALPARCAPEVEEAVSHVQLRSLWR